MHSWLRRLVARRGKAEAPAADTTHFARGMRTVADLIAPAVIEQGRDHLRIDRQYCRTLIVTGYPRYVRPGWLSPLINFGEPIKVSLHLQPLDASEMVQSLTRKMVQFHSSRLLAERDGRLADPERDVAYSDAERLRDMVQLGREKVWAAGFYILVLAGSQAQLDDRTRRVESLLGSMLSQSRIAYYEQERGFRACLPLGQDWLQIARNMDTTSLATMLPFPAPTLAMPQGVLYGIARFNQAPVIIDAFDESLTNANMVILARSGAGKSYFTKLMALRNLYRGIDFFIIDPEDEYRPLVQAAGDWGQYVRLASTTGQHLNPFDLPPADSAGEGLNPLDEQVAALIELLDILLAEQPGRSLGSTERGVLEKALYHSYALAGITRLAETQTRPVPLLCDLLAALDETAGEVASSLAARLERYAAGSLSGLFAGQTNVVLNSHLVVFNVHALERELRPAAIHMITSLIWNRVRRALKPRMLIIDEAWSLMQFPEGGAFLDRMARSARKRYLGLVTISQDAGDFLGSAAGQSVLTNATMKLLMRQDESSIETVGTALKLSPDECRYLLSANKGEGLFLARGSRVALTAEASPHEHQLATTAPQEMYERRQGVADLPGGQAPSSTQSQRARRRLPPLVLPDEAG